MCFGATRYKNSKANRLTTQEAETASRAVDVNPNSLQRAEAATGFKLNDIVITKSSQAFGQVIGFGRLNVPSYPAGERVLLVKFGQDQDGLDVEVIHPTDLNFPGRSA